jgi:import inner membrane translocase subunit TIM50
MFSRLAMQAPRWGGLAASRVVPLATTARPVIATSPWIRTFAAKKKGDFTPPSSKSNAPQNEDTAPKASSKPETDPATGEPPVEGSSKTSATEPSNASDPTPSESEQIPFHKLPDLTQGIPSTLEAEFEEKTGKPRGSSALEAVSQPEYERRSGQQDYVSTSERNRRWWARFMLYTMAAGSLTGVAYLGRNWDDEIDVKRHPDIPNGLTPSLWWQRAKARLDESRAYYQDPEFEKLLPDPQPWFERPYTLCISLDDMLVHQEWSRKHGWRVAKRPGVDYFIRYLSQYYELVLFTTTPSAMGDPVFRKLDPFQFIMWPLYREATKFEDGEIVKDLSYLNRDLSKVIIIDSNPKHVRKQPENAIILEPWKGDRDDKELVALIPFLEYIHTMQYSDVRKVLKAFEGKHIPTEFSRREAIARKEFNAQLAAKAKHSKPSGFGALTSALGLKSSNMSMTMAPEGEQNPNEAFAQGKMLQDIARERGQRHYEAMERDIKQHGETWLKEQKEAMDKVQKEAMENMFGSWGSMFLPKDAKKDEPQQEPKKE